MMYEIEKVVAFPVHHSSLLIHHYIERTGDEPDK